MSILVIGAHHRSAPVDLLERLTIGADDVEKAVQRLTLDDDVREAVVISTCNRTEIYLVAERFHPAFDSAQAFLAELGQLSEDELAAHLFAHYDDAAAAHLLDVAAGLDSAVLGETEILGQVRRAWEVAQSAGTARAQLNLLFRTALETGKRVRTETEISRGTSSVSHAAVEMLSDEVGALDGKQVLVLGAGAMGEGVAVALARAGGAHITVANRTAGRADELADKVGGQSVALPELERVLADTDVIIAGTGAATAVLTADAVAAARAAAGVARPLYIVDIAMPRNVDPAVGELPGVTVVDLDDLRDWADRGRQRRSVEAEQVRHIVAEELQRYTANAASRQVAPLLAELRAAADTIRTAELARFTKRLSGLEAAELAAVEQLTKGIVAKLLHDPTVRLKLQAGTPAGQRNAAALNDLFGLGNEIPG